MKKTSILVGFLAVALFIVPSSVYPWGSAVHAYIASHLKPGNANVVYGSLAPDMFNYAFDLGALKDIMYQQFHTSPELLWGIAATFNEKSLAYGFMNHKEDDQTAHYSGVVFGRGEGYVIAKAKVLDEYLAGKFPDYAGLKSLAPQVSLEVAHNLIENSIDVLIRRVDRLVGLKLMRAATVRDSVFPSMVVNVWGGADPSLPTVIPAVESAFKTLMFNYGGLFATNNEAQIIDTLSAQMAGFAPVFLPQGIELPYETAFAIAKAGTIKGIEICRGSSLIEIMLTIVQARRNLSGYKLN
jgi:hypothetical protein